VVVFLRLPKVVMCKKVLRAAQSVVLSLVA
jgi:hypothetical protein